MATSTPPSTPSPTTFVEIEPPPDISTPVWPPDQQLQQQPRFYPQHVPTFYLTPTQSSSAPHGTYVRFVSPTPDGSPLVQVPTWQVGSDSMQLCTSPDTSPSSSGAQHDLPGYLPAPGKEIQHLNAQVQGNWDNLFDFIKQQEKAVCELTQGQKTATSHSDKQLGT